MTLLENNRLTMQMRGELVISRRELQVTRREADEATRSAQDKQSMEQGIAALREVHARVARGDIIARASTVSGPLLPIAISLNLMLDRISALSQRGARYDQLAQECRTLQESIERLGQGLPLWAPNQPMPQSATELRSVYIGLNHLQRSQEGQWRRVSSAMDSINKLTKRIHEALNEIKQSNLLKSQTNASFERMVLDRVVREIDLLEEQQHNILNQIAQVTARSEHQNNRGGTQTRPVSHTQYANEPTHTPKPMLPVTPNQLSPIRQNAYAQSNYNQRFYQLNQVDRMPVDE